MCPPPRPSRRTVLAAAIVVAGAPLASCTPQPPPPAPPDPFEPLIESAIADATLAEAVAAAHPPLATVARLVAADRKVHVDALTIEVRRATPSPSATSLASSAITTSGPPVPTEPAAAKAALLEASSAAQRLAAGLVGGLPRHRAGLAASIAACCASHAVVLA